MHPFWVVIVDNQERMNKASKQSKSAVLQKLLASVVKWVETFLITAMSSTGLIKLGMIVIKTYNYVSPSNPYNLYVTLRKKLSFSLKFKCQPQPAHY